MNHLYDYQNVLVEDVLANIKQKPVVLAAAPGAGKTEMAIQIIKDLLARNPDLKVLIQAHGTTVLRQQFYTRISSVFEGKYQQIKNMDEFDESKEITIALPHAFKKKVPKFDLLVVDEAHEFYFADKYGKELRDKMKPKMQLLLTGTHFKFTRENNLAEDAKVKKPYHISMITMNEIIQTAPSQISNLRLLVCQSCYDFREKDYNADGNLKENTKIGLKATENTTEKVIKALLRHLNPSPLPSHMLRKTMFACHNIKQAYTVYKYLLNSGISATISVSEEDGASDIKDLGKIEHGVDQIDIFKKDENIQALVVVNRAVLGFNHPELENVVDMSGTRNIARIYQLMCRAVRSFPNENQKDREKLFIKVGPHGSGGHEYTLHLITSQNIPKNKTLVLLI